MMKSIGLMLLFLSICGQSGYSLAFDRDFLHGEILEVDGKGGGMVIRADQGEESDRAVTVVLPETILIDSPDGGLRLPGCISAGKHVRIWGSFNPRDGGSFRADEVRSCGMASCSDPTGVRSRLSRNRGNRSMGEMCR